MVFNAFCMHLGSNKENEWDGWIDEACDTKVDKT